MSKLLEIGAISLSVFINSYINILCKLNFLLRTFICMYNKEIEVIEEGL